ncbi:MAG: hypothetical protein Q9195_007820 [Heterodermia aff. obscurata]
MNSLTTSPMVPSVTSIPPAIAGSPKSSQVQENRIKYLERRLALLEHRRIPSVKTLGDQEQLGISIADDPNTCDDYHILTNGQVNEEPIVFRGKEFKTRYYGPSNPISTADYFPGLRDFMQSAVDSHPRVASVEKDLKSIIARHKRAKRAEQNEYRNDTELFALLPDKSVTDRYITMYFATLETTYRVLHQPTFCKDYEDLWMHCAQSNSGTVVLVLLVIAILSCSYPETDSLKFTGNYTSAREAALRLIEVCESWLNKQSHKHLTLTTMQVHCLLFLAKQMNLWKRKRLWTTAGSLVRFGMSAGLHRNSDLLNKKISFFAQEMRRRLWATMIELELQESIDRGMPAISAGLSFDCGLPTNIDDRDLCVNSTVPVSSKRLEDFTATSFLQASQQSLHLRASLNSIVNGSSEDISYSDVMAYDERIRRHVGQIPQWDIRGNPLVRGEVNHDSPCDGTWEIIRKQHPTANNPIGALTATSEMVSSEASPVEGLLSAETGSLSNPLLAKTLLELQLQQFLILLHSPFARRAQTNPLYQGSVMTCYGAAHRIVELHSKLLATGNSVFSLLRNDVIRAAFTICHNVSLSCSVNGNFCLQRLGISLLPVIEDSMSLLEDKAMRCGTSFQSYYFISSAYALIRSKIDGARKDHDPAEEAVERLCRICYKVIALQEQPFTLESDKDSITTADERYG